jgi:hypothetical protein
MSQFNKYLEMVQEGKDYNYNEGMFDKIKYAVTKDYLDLTWQLQANKIQIRKNDDLKDVSFSKTLLDNNKKYEKFNVESQSFFQKKIKNLFPEEAKISNISLEKDTNNNITKITFKINKQKELYKILSERKLTLDKIENKNDKMKSELQYLEEIL